MLKVIMKQRQAQLLHEKLTGLEAKAEELKKREAELEAAIAEVSNEEEIEAVNAELEEHSAAVKANEEELQSVRNDIDRIESEIADLEKEQGEPEPVDDINEDGKSEERKEKKVMFTRKSFFGLDMQERTAFFNDESVQKFISEIRNSMKTRAVVNASVLVPVEVFRLIRERIGEYSKLYSLVNVQRVSGDGRQPVMGAIPEAIWTEACAALNELDLTFGSVELDGYKVGGYIPVCNATLDDSDEDLAAIVIDAIGKAIGLALDKAIVAGTGVKMPLGIYTRLAQTAAGGTHVDALDWVDYHTSNIIDVSGAEDDLGLWRAIVAGAGIANEEYASGEAVWVMNHKTRQKLAAAALSVNAAGAIVSGLDDTMPVLGGKIVELSFIPDDFVLGGYIDTYVLAEKRAITLDYSEHAKFIEDYTIFRGRARYDGQPVIPNAFVAFKLSAGATWNVTFAGTTESN